MPVRSHAHLHWRGLLHGRTPRRLDSYLQQGQSRMRPCEQRVQRCEWSTHPACLSASLSRVQMMSIIIPEVVAGSLPTDADSKRTENVGQRSGYAKAVAEVEVSKTKAPVVTAVH